jgi:hypothetical protein
MKRITIIIILLFIVGINEELSAQGCVAIKGTAGVCSRPGEATGWELNLNSRYFKSYKHFVGTIEQKQREEEGTNVINHSAELDVTATRYLNLRWSLLLLFRSWILRDHHCMNMMGQQGIAHIHLALAMQDFPHTGGRLIPKLRTRGICKSVQE